MIPSSGWRDMYLKRLANFHRFIPKWTDHMSIHRLGANEQEFDEKKAGEG